MPFFRTFGALAKLLFVCLAAFIFGCQDNDVKTYQSTKSLTGLVQKGSYLNGSSVTIQILDEAFSPTGQSFTVSTTDDLGSFNLDKEVSGAYIEIVAQGFYFNEVSGKTADASLTLRAVTSIKSDLKSNVNVLTSLSRNRIIHLVSKEGMAFDDAKKKAETEVLALFKIPYDASVDFNLMDIGKNGTGDAMLLAVSSVLQGSLTTAELSELLTAVATDIEADGKIDTDATTQAIYNNAVRLTLANVRKNLAARYQALGTETLIPNFEFFAKRLVPLTVMKTIPADKEFSVPSDLGKVQLYFNKDLNASTINTNNIKLTLSTGEEVPGTVTYAADSFRIDFAPAANLVPEKEYEVHVTTGLKSADDEVFSDFTFQFNTMDIDLVTDLKAYYPFNGNANDESGNSFNALAVNAQYGADVDGVSGKACTFSGDGSYLEIPNVFNLTERVWTYSIWFKLDDLESGTVAGLLATRLSGNSFFDFPLYIRSSIKAIATYNETALNIPDEISTNGWYHAVMVIDNGTINMYLNGELKVTKSGFVSYQSNSGNPDFLGDAVGSFEFYTGNYYVSEKYKNESFPAYIKGSVDNIRFYKRALDAREVKALYIGKR